MNSKRKVFVVGVGMTKFEKPGSRQNFDYPDMSLEAGKKALTDANLSYTDIEQACVGYCYGDSTCGQRALYQIGMTGIPIYNVNNNCSTGSTALMIGRQLIEGGLANCVMVLGFEKMEKGSLGTKYSDRTNPLDKHVEKMMESFDISASPITSQMFGNAGIEHMKRYGTKPEHFAKIAQKNHKHSSNNPNSQFQSVYTLDEILKSGNVYDFLTKLQCCPTSDGAACAILASEEFVIKKKLEEKAVEILSQAMATDLPSTFNEKNCIKLVGYDMTRKAADQVYKDSGIGPDKVDVVELHDCFSANELITYEALRLCPEGKAGEFIDRGDNTYGGKYVVNPSGGLISKGHPLGATGVAQCAELCWQLRGEAGDRQVSGAKVALQHNVGLGGAVVITMYAHGYPDKRGKKTIQMVGTKIDNKAIKIDNKSKTSDDKTSKIDNKDSGVCKMEKFASKVIFERIEEELKKDGKNYTKKINGIFCFKVRKDGEEGTWVVDAKNGEGSVKFDPSGKGDVIITIEDNDMLELVTGKINAQQAFFQGKLKLKGNIGLAMKLQQLLKPSDFKSKL